MNPVVAVVGKGMLAELACEELLEMHTIVCLSDVGANVPKSVELILILDDDSDSSIFLEAEGALQQGDIPWLCAFVSFDEGVVGPCVRPSTPGCSQCADHRRLLAGRDSEERLEQLLNNLLTPGERAPNPYASITGLRQMALLIAAEAQRILQGSRAHTEERIYLINLITLATSLHTFLPNPLCPVCGQLPDDSLEAARISLHPRPKISCENYRSRPLDELKEVLIQDYVDGRTGLFNDKKHDLLSPFAGSVVNLPLFFTGDEVTGGRAHSYAESELTAILEGLERSCGLAPRGKRTVIRDSFRNLASQALDPVKAGVYSQKQYGQQDFPFEPFDPDQPIDWVWGYSFLQERPILVPELLGYYSLGDQGGFVYETSNGCALGGSLEEAIFYGILEVVERDSFLMTWYAKLPVPRLDPASANDRELRLMIERLQAVTGYELHLFNTTMENGIPSIWALAKSTKFEEMNLICAAGAHLDPIRAAKSAIHELAGMMLPLKKTFRERHEECVQMFYDPSLVQQMGDHSLLYGLPQAEERLHFLLDERRPLRSFDEEYKRKPGHRDLTDDVNEMLQAFRRLSLDVIVVDQTSLETLRNGLHCVKVLIPGMIPMSFGHHLSRLTGLERVLNVPVELGYAKLPLTLAQLNPHPHPFP
ncbi:TOMM precursor leader peptide-binding protein [Paenibacillus sp. OSY-SE]|uniref:TOMM precursor leader peptide-binding protein n=1 Tax=Paenibacillus sp. OSY-SE TaxID=1196323 RepID=UPI0003047C5E|nr:TOMM precursor leader peptide-binding protein [Paenibacillus sp. OSY-SE]